jgi:hypothetical protein
MFPFCFTDESPIIEELIAVYKQEEKKKKKAEVVLFCIILTLCMSL